MHTLNSVTSGALKNLFQMMFQMIFKASSMFETMNGKGFVASATHQDLYR